MEGLAPTDSVGLGVKEVEGEVPLLNDAVGVCVGLPVKELVDVPDGLAPKVRLGVGLLEVGEEADTVDDEVVLGDSPTEIEAVGVCVGLLPERVLVELVEAEEPCVKLEVGVEVGELVREDVLEVEAEAPWVMLLVGVPELDADEKVGVDVLLALAPTVTEPVGVPEGVAVMEELVLEVLGTPPMENVEVVEGAPGPGTVVLVGHTLCDREAEGLLALAVEFLESMVAVGGPLGEEGATEEELEAAVDEVPVRELLGLTVGDAVGLVVGDDTSAAVVGLGLGLGLGLLRLGLGLGLGLGVPESSCSGESVAVAEADDSGGTAEGVEVGVTIGGEAEGVGVGLSVALLLLLLELLSVGEPVGGGVGGGVEEGVIVGVCVCVCVCVCEGVPELEAPRDGVPVPVAEFEGEMEGVGVGEGEGVEEGVPLVVWEVVGVGETVEEPD